MQFGEGELTTFPLSHSLPSSPVVPEDGSFSILPRYLLQKVKNTFISSASPAEHAPAGGISRPSSSRQTSAEKESSGSAAHSAKIAFAVASSSSSDRFGHPQTSSSRDPRVAGKGSSRNPRLSNLSGNRRAVAPVLSTAVSETGNFALFNNHAVGSTALSRSHSRSLGTLPESSSDSSPPPPYTADLNLSYSSIPGFPLNRDPNEDAKSVSSAAGPTLAVAQIFRRLRGEALSRDYW